MSQNEDEKSEKLPTFSKSSLKASIHRKSLEKSQPDEQSNFIPTEKWEPEVIFTFTQNPESAKKSVSGEILPENSFTNIQTELSKTSLARRAELPKKPVPPHLKFFSEIAKECNERKSSIKLGEALEIWKNLSNKEKEPYLEEYKKEQKEYREKISNYRKSLDHQGIDHTKIQKFTVKKIKKILELNSGLHQKRALHKEKNNELFYTLRTAVAIFQQELGRSVQEFLEEKNQEIHIFLIYDVIDIELIFCEEF